jgi:hypothetical protein
MWLISNLNKISDIPVPFYRNRNKDRFVILHYERGLTMTMAGSSPH